MSNSKHELAWKHFYPEGNGKAKPGYCLHHKDETLRHENPDRYNEWNPEDLVMMTSSEHGKLHHTGFVYTEEQRQRMSIVHKGIRPSEETRQKMSKARMGMKMSDKTRNKISKARIGMSFSKEHHDNLSISHGGKAFYSIDLVTGEILKWVNQQECARYIGCHGETVRLGLLKNRKAFKRYVFKFVDDVENNKGLFQNGQ